MGAQQEPETSTTQPDVTSKVTMHRLEMPDEMKNQALKAYDEAKLVHKIEKDLATAVKRTFDEHQGPTWHCIIGKGFGCSVAYDTQFLIFFQVDELFILLFKSVE